MDINEFQDRAFATAVYPECGNATERALNYTIVGLAGEAGELSNKWKKVLRGDVQLDDEARIRLAGELFGTLWYAAGVATELGFNLSEIASMGLSELAKRAATGTLKGGGDDRGAQAMAAQQDGFQAMQEAQAEPKGEQAAPATNPEPETDKPANLFDRETPLTDEEQAFHDNVVEVVLSSILGMARGDGASAVDIAAQTLAAVVAKCVKPKSKEMILTDLVEHVRRSEARFCDKFLATSKPAGTA